MDYFVPVPEPLVPLPPGAPNIMFLPSAVFEPGWPCIGCDTFGLPCVPLFGCGITTPYHLVLSAQYAADILPLDMFFA